ncbi:hypothetical protein CPT_Sushi55 [Klebsiella phage Sushi]|uniref:Uncharacterized protein n=2 Tax=Webervirus sushi TaxID=1981043 RepID=A0A0H4U1W4_9CAUD|nr:hypothetical protein AVT24_gp55 [Klebsiella phage Sushi]AKQ07526.1 hypothetical protein CPT_Sushi55 [Klebsiella phage Sushi]QBZ71133.1 hypothetical protein CPT_Sanco_002 [Klebsiella phage Sanco]
MNSARIITNAAKAERKRIIEIVEKTIPNHPLYRKAKAELLSRIKGDTK